MFRRSTFIIRYCLPALLLGLSLSACESPFADSADRTAYGLESKRQRQSLGELSDTALSHESLPSAITPEAYGLVPHTDNAITSVRELPLPPGAPAASQPATQSSTQPATPSDPLSRLLDSMGGPAAINLMNTPDLPAFPRPVSPGKTRLIFTLDDCFNYALAHSRDYISQKEDLYIVALNVALERHQFEPRLFAQTSAGIAGAGEASDYNAAFNAAQTVGVKQKLPYGGEIVATALAQSVQQLKSNVATSTSADLALQANIPLLRGAGMVAQENLIQAERDLVYQVRSFERFRRSYLVTVANTYFNLINQRVQVLNRFRSVRSYIFITERTEALFKAGRPRISLLDVQRAKQSEFQARNDLTNAIEQYELAVDSFKIVIGMPAEQSLDLAPQYLKIKPPQISDAAAVAIADRLRLDLQTTRDRVDDARRGIKIASNNLLPDVNLTARADLNSNPSTKSIGADARYGDYSAGVVVDWPLDRVAERNAYRVSLINLEQAKRNVEQTQDQVAVDVRAAIRQVRLQLYILALQKSNIDLAEKRREFAGIQFKNGKIDNRDYLDAENALVDAQNRFAQAISSLQIATLQYLRNTDQLRVDYKGRLIPPDAAAGMNTPAAETQPATQPATQPTTQP